LSYRGTARSATEPFYQYGAPNPIVLDVMSAASVHRAKRHGQGT